MRKLGIFGGTFDPVHWGHLLVAEAAVSQVPLEQVIWVPTLCPPHKQAEKFEHRFQMVQSAIADNPAMQIALLCSNQTTSNYAIQTLIDLKTLYPHTHWYWIIGLDAFQTLPRWYRRQELIAECDWLVAPRLASTALNQPDAMPSLREASPTAVCSTTIATPVHLSAQVAQNLKRQGISISYSVLQLPYIGISASFIRHLCSDHQSIRYLVPESVRHYITSHNLYFRQ